MFQCYCLYLMTGKIHQGDYCFRFLTMFAHLCENLRLWSVSPVTLFTHSIVALLTRIQIRSIFFLFCHTFDNEFVFTFISIIVMSVFVVANRINEYVPNMLTFHGFRWLVYCIYRTLFMYHFKIYSNILNRCMVNTCQII